MGKKAIKEALLKPINNEWRARQKLVGVTAAYEAGGSNRDALRVAAEKFVAAHKTVDQLLKKEEDRESIIQEAKLRGLL